MINILLTSVGRRKYLVEYFKQALNANGKVICANMYSEAAGMYAGDFSIITPPSHSKSYIPAIIELCFKYKVGLICSLHDLDVFILSQHLNVLQQTGAVLVLPAAHWGRLALDKYECSVFLKKNGFDVPWCTLNLQEAKKALEANIIRFPLILKARSGFGSLGLKFCHDFEELESAFYTAQKQVGALMQKFVISPSKEENVIIQQGIMGKEYCIDVINDLTGNYVCHFVCEVRSMRAGETDTVTTVAPELVGNLPVRLSRLTRHLGPWGIDCIEDNGVLRIIDINPRFTGDYPFHHVTGANIPAALISWAQGKEPDPSWLKAEAGVRCYKDLVPARACAKRRGGPATASLLS